MKIFVDANVIIDYLVDRMPFADDAEAVIDACVQNGNSFFGVCPHRSSVRARL